MNGYAIRALNSARRRLNDLMDDIGPNHPTEEEADLIAQLEREIDEAQDYLDNEVL
jgi:hypothetical protein